jgi:hypothetical protein
VNITYYEFPLNIKIIADNRIAFATAGLTLSLPSSAHFKNNRSGAESDITKSIEGVILSANFGVGAQFKLSIFLLSFELRYSQCLTNIIDTQLNSLQKIKSNSIQLYAGLHYAL